MFKDKDKNKNKKDSKKGKSLIRLVISFLMAIGIFGGLLAFEKWTMNNVEFATVLVAKDKIPKGTYITSENKDSLFIEIESNSLFTSDQTFSSLKDIPNGRLNFDLEKQEIVFKKDIVKKEILTDYIEDNEKIIEMSVKVSDIGDAVGGRIRSGDLVNLSFVSDMSKESSLIYENVFVEKALNASGDAINRENETPTTILIITVDKEMEQNILNAIATGSLKITKTK